MSDIEASFKFLYPLLSKNGVYMVEDLCTAYWPRYGGGLQAAGSFIEYSKALVDELNAYHIREKDCQTDFTRNTVSIHFYDSIVVFEKGFHGDNVFAESGAHNKQFRRRKSVEQAEISEEVKARRARRIAAQKARSMSTT